MSTTYGDTRWWENYAVRYLMPSVAGMAIVKWICWHGCDKLIPLLNLPLEVREPGVGFETASLILLFLYGNLFCYVASYPILVFHATRVIDFADDKWKHHRWLLDGYIATVLLGCFALFAARCLGDHRRRVALALTVLFAICQGWRVYHVLANSNRIRIRGSHGIDGDDKKKETLLYGYTRSIAVRRGQREETIETDTRPVIITDAETEDYDDDRTVRTLGERVSHKEYIETYKHLREHGNSAFIFVLELVLATLVYCVTIPSECATKQLSAIGLLFAIWALPAVSAHLMGQYLERRFSHFERRLI